MLHLKLHSPVLFEARKELQQNLVLLHILYAQGKSFLLLSSELRVLAMFLKRIE